MNGGIKNLALCALLLMLASGCSGDSTDEEYSPNPYGGVTFKSQCGSSGCFAYIFDDQGQLLCDRRYGYRGPEIDFKNLKCPPGTEAK